MTGADLPALSIAELQRLLRHREVSPREVIDALQTRIESIDPQIGAYLSIDFEAAAKEAEKANLTLPLGGVPIAIKDIISVAGQPCTCASKILHNYRAMYDATVIRRLRAAGAIPRHRVRVDEYGGEFQPWQTPLDAGSRMRNAPGWPKPMSRPNPR